MKIKENIKEMKSINDKLDKLLENYNEKDFTKFKREKANNKIGEDWIWKKKKY